MSQKYLKILRPLYQNYAYIYSHRALRSFSIHENKYHETTESNIMYLRNLLIDNCEHFVDLPLIVSPYGNLILCVGYIYPINDVILCTEK